jgi:hypothetical protein
MKRTDYIYSLELTTAETDIIHRTLTATYIQLKDEIHQAMAKEPDEDTERELRILNVRREELRKVLYDFSEVTDHKFTYN